MLDDWLDICTSKENSYRNNLKCDQSCVSSVLHSAVKTASVGRFFRYSCLRFALGINPEDVVLSISGPPCPKKKKLEILYLMKPLGRHRCQKGFRSFMGVRNCL